MSHIWTWEPVKRPFVNSGNISKSMPAQQALSNSSSGVLIFGLLCFESRWQSSRFEKLVLVERIISWLVVVGFMLFAFVLPN